MSIVWDSCHLLVGFWRGLQSVSGSQGRVLSSAQGVFPALAPCLLPGLSCCSQMHADSSVVYTLTLAPKDGVIPYFLTPAFKTYQCDLCLQIFCIFWLFSCFPPKGGLCAVELILSFQQYVGYGICLSSTIFLMSGDDNWCLLCLKDNLCKSSNYLRRSYGNFLSLWNNHAPLTTKWVSERELNKHWSIE